VQGEGVGVVSHDEQISGKGERTIFASRLTVGDRGDGGCELA